jgi:exopolysaccharide biosynthesis predicted pyruvyltransferase EpsI
LINKKISYISNFEYIVTDRLHGLYFGLLANSKILALNSIDFKVKEASQTINFFLEDNIVNLISNCNLNPKSFLSAYKYNPVKINERLRRNYNNMISFILE